MPAMVSDAEVADEEDSSELNMAAEEEAVELQVFEEMEEPRREPAEVESSEPVIMLLLWLWLWCCCCRS